MEEGLNYFVNKRQTQLYFVNGWRSQVFQMKDGKLWDIKKIIGIKYISNEEVLLTRISSLLNVRVPSGKSDIISFCY